MSAPHGLAQISLEDNADLVSQHAGAIFSNSKPLTDWTSVAIGGDQVVRVYAMLAAACPILNDRVYAVRVLFERKQFSVKAQIAAQFDGALLENWFELALDDETGVYRCNLAVAFVYILRQPTQFFPGQRLYAQHATEPAAWRRSLVNSILYPHRAKDLHCACIETSCPRV